MMITGCLYCKLLLHTQLKTHFAKTFITFQYQNGFMEHALHVISFTSTRQVWLSLH